MTKPSLMCRQNLTSKGHHYYHIGGNFYMVQTFAVFAELPKTAETFINTVKNSSGASGGIIAKVCTRRDFPLYGIMFEVLLLQI